MPGQARHSWRFSPAQSACRFRRFGVLIHESHEAHCERSCLSRPAVRSDRASAAALRITLKSTEPAADARSGRWGDGLAESPTRLQADCATGICVDPIEPVMKFWQVGTRWGWRRRRKFRSRAGNVRPERNCTLQRVNLGRRTARSHLRTKHAVGVPSSKGGPRTCPSQGRHRPTLPARTVHSASRTCPCGSVVR